MDQYPLLQGKSQRPQRSKCSNEIHPTVRLTNAALCSCIFIRQALGFGLSERGFLGQQSLPFVPLSSLAPLQDNGRQSRVFSRTTGQCSITGREKHQMIKVRTGETQGSLLFCQCDPCLAAKVFFALVALGFSRANEYLQAISF